MRYKPDWENAIDNMEAWWHGENIGRPAIQVTAPKEGVKTKVVPVPDDIYERWTNIDYVIEKTKAAVSSTFYGGEAFPMAWPNLGPDVSGAYMGCDLIFGERTSWSVPILDTWEALPKVHFNPDGKYWRMTVAMTSALLEVSQGDWIVGITDLHLGADTAAAIRDPQRLCTDLLDYPEKVKELLAVTQPLFGIVYTYLAAMIRPVQGVTTTWLPVCTKGRYYPLSNDFSCMVSPAMFEEFFVDGIIADAKQIDHALYHLDGPGAIKHLDTLLAIPQIHGIQWVPGQREPSPLQWIPLLQKIQKAGKLLDISLEANDVKELLRYLSPKGLMLRTGCASEKEAKDLLTAAQEWSR